MMMAASSLHASSLVPPRGRPTITSPATGAPSVGSSPESSYLRSSSWEHMGLPSRGEIASWTTTTSNAAAAKVRRCHHWCWLAVMAGVLVLLSSTSSCRLGGNGRWRPLFVHAWQNSYRSHSSHVQGRLSSTRQQLVNGRVIVERAPDTSRSSFHVLSASSPWHRRGTSGLSCRFMSTSSSSDGASATAPAAPAHEAIAGEPTEADDAIDDAEKAAVQAAREARKAEKERLKAEKKAKQEAERIAREEANRIADVTYLAETDENMYPAMGDYSRVMSRSRTGRKFVDVASLERGEHEVGSTVWLRGRLQSIRVKGGSCFLVLRQDSFHTVQACYFKDKTNPDESQKMIQYLKTLTVESVVDLKGVLASADVKSCSVQSLEVSIQRIHAVSKADPVLPFLVEDAARSEEEVEASQDTDRPFPRLGQELRLDNRWMDLRAPANNAILRVQSAVCQLFRESLYRQGFVEIHTPKLIAGESESGAGVFTTDYFGTTACLAQSPQLYKQMAISSDFGRVFEIGPVFRAEKSHTRRHLCEFTGLDLEMSIQDHYMETLEVIHSMFKDIFNGLETRWAKELAVIREQFESSPVAFTDDPCVLHWPEAMDLLRDEGFDVGDGMDDLSGAMELALGRAVKAKYGTDFFMLDKYPASIRPFYTMPDPDDKRFSNSYDIFIRGQEICSGAQRCHDPDLLVEILKEKGVEPGDGLKSYIESFRHGVSPHAGAGIGLERVVFLYLGLDNVRKASMFPRDPNRCTP